MTEDAWSWSAIETAGIETVRSDLHRRAGGALLTELHLPTLFILLSYEAGAWPVGWSSSLALRTKARRRCADLIEPDH
jgi:hypothetical protein